MLLDHLNHQLAAIAARHQTRSLRMAHSPTGPRQRVRDAQASPGDERELLMFCSNDYLGLAGHPALAQALAEGAAHWAGGSGASHLISGHTAAHEALEATLAGWYAPHIPQARCLTFSTGYMANLAVTTALGDAEAEFFSDALNHASLIDGMRLAKAPVQRYPHADLATLAAQLAASTARIKLIVTDGVFSMDGDIAPLPALLRLAEAHDAWLVVDDAHGFGVLGPQGRGSLAHFGLSSPRLILMGTLGKAAGVSGAFVAGHRSVIEWLVNTSRSYIFTTGAPPLLAETLLTAVDLIEHGDTRRAHLAALIARFKAGLTLARWQLLPSDTPIQPLVIGDNHEALAVSRALDAEGLWVPAIRPPTVPKGAARLRITLSAAHSVEQVDRLVAALNRLEAQHP